MTLREKLLQTLGGVVASGLGERFERDSKRIDVVVRTDGDVQVELHLDGRQGSPFEQLFAVPEGSEEGAAAEISSFVAALLDEELVLVVDGRLMRGGQRWLRPDHLQDATSMVFAASWAGYFRPRARAALN